MKIEDSDHEDENGFLDGEKRAAEKQASRDRDQAMLDSGEITLAQLKRKNDFFANVDFSSVRIGKVGGVPYEDLNKRGSKRFKL